MSNQIDILKIRSELEKNIRELTNSYTQLQISHFEENQKLNSEVIKLSNNNKDLLNEIEEKVKDNIELTKKCSEYEDMINSQNEKISTLEEEEDNSQKVSILKKQADEIERLENYIKILESQKEKKNIELSVEESKEDNEESDESNPKKRKKSEEKEEIILWKIMIYNSYYKDPEKLLIARNEYSKHINKPLEEITDEIVGKTSAGINGWYKAGINEQINYIFGNITKLNKLIKADISLASMITDLLEINGENNTEEIIKYITNNKNKFIDLLVDDKAFLDMITDMIKNKEYEKFMKSDSEPEDESEPEPEPESKTGVPEEYFKLKTGQIVYSITSCTGDIKLFNSENNNYIGVKIGDYLEGDGQAKVKCFPYDIKENKLIRSESEEETLLTGDQVISASDEEEQKEESVEEQKEESDEKKKEESDEESEEEIDMTKIKKMQYKKKDYFRIKDQDPPFIYENNGGLIGKKIGKIIMVGTRKKVEFF